VCVCVCVCARVCVRVSPSPALPSGNTVNIVNSVRAPGGSYLQTLFIKGELTTGKQQKIKNPAELLWETTLIQEMNK